MERIRQAKEVYGMRRRTSSHRLSRLGVWLVVIATAGSLVGCQHLKTGAATMGVVGVSSALGVASVPTAVLGGVTAATVSALSAEKSVKSEPISVTADTVVNKAPDNFFTLLGKLVGMGGWLLGLVLLLPMVIGWIIPGPLQKAKKKR